MAVKYVFVLGGVVSGLGQGITAASLGRLLKARGYAVTMQKFDPYINVDPGTMNPIQHGEVFVTDDGAETDLDLGHYERFIDERLTRVSNVTSGRVYRTVLERERRGDFGGGTVQVIPHITNEIKRRFYRGEDKIAIIEVGGTVGDMESQAFLEAIRQFQNEVGKENAIILLVTLIPYLKASGEMKTKPTQGCVRELQSIGLRPDVLVLDEPVDGLDPVMRRQVWNLVLADVAENGTTVLISSHNLRELEDVCDHVGIMNGGKVLLEHPLAELQANIVKVFVALPDEARLPEGLDILHRSAQGHLHTLIVHGDAAEVMNRLSTAQPQYLDVVPLTLEEIFIYELGGADYAVKDILL